MVVGLLVLTGCDPVIGSASGPARHATLTSASGMKYRYAGSRTGLFAIPGTPTWDTNVREVFWYPDSKFAADQQACMTWNIVAGETRPGLLQPGVALRIAPVTADNKGVKAVTVTQNIYFAGIWMFNVHVWNSLDSAHPFTQIANFDLSPVVGSLIGSAAPMVRSPWHVCARVVDRTFSFMVWTGTNPKPAWNDPLHVRTATLPAGWDYSGYAGGYIGHLHQGQAGAFSAVATQVLP